MVFDAGAAAVDASDRDVTGPRLQPPGPCRPAAGPRWPTRSARRCRWGRRRGRCSRHRRRRPARGHRRPSPRPARCRPRTAAPSRLLATDGDAVSVTVAVVGAGVPAGHLPRRRRRSRWDRSGGAGLVARKSLALLLLVPQLPDASPACTKNSISGLVREPATGPPVRARGPHEVDALPGRGAAGVRALVEHVHAPGRRVGLDRQRRPCRSPPSRSCAGSSER